VSLTADIVFRGAVIHRFAGADEPSRSLALRGDRIVAVGEQPHDLDDLVGAGTKVIDDPTLVLMPGFHDTHMHQMWMAGDMRGVQINRARTLDDVLDAIAARARETPAGEWIVTSANWHETLLPESRFPTAQELDRAAPEHPVVVRRGGHNLVANSMAMTRAGISRDSPDPQRGTLVRDEDGNPTGRLIEPHAMAPVLNLLPPMDFEDRVDALAVLTQEFNRRGIVAVRDAGADAGALHVYQEAHRRGQLTTRTRMLVLLNLASDTEARLAEIDSWPIHTGYGDDMLRVDALKLLLDGGVEAAAMEEPYELDPTFRGHMLIDPGDIERLTRAGVDRGWKMAAHAFGDVTVRTLTDVYERILSETPLPPGSLVIEHAALADAALRRRIIDLGIGVTVQYPVLHRLGGNAVRYWGRERADKLFPIREWVEEGAIIGGGSDAFIGDWDVLGAIHGMVTRETAIGGVMGAGSAIDRRTAFELYTNRAAELVGEGDLRGSLAAGKLADVVAFREDPLTCDLDALTELSPAFTLLGGRPVHDADGVFH
jgi:predicted amidohydrolase YtcJ